MIDQLFFVFSYSSIQFVYQSIDRRVHVFFDGVCVNRTTIHVDCGFSLMPKLFDSKYTVNVRYKIKMSLYFLDSCLDIAPQGLGYFNVMA